VASLARQGSAVLRASGVPSAERDAEVLLAHALGEEPARLHARPDAAVTEEVEARFRELLARRGARVPLQYLTGIQEFWSLRFRVTPAVLIPRPETEGLVEAFLRLLDRPEPLVADVGTGSGCLAVAVVHEVPGATVHAVDDSEEALAVARENAVAHGVEGRIVFHRGDLVGPLLTAGLPGRVDAILSNPPYVGEEEMTTLEPEVALHEPRRALTPGRDALLIHRRLAREAASILKPGGHLIVEIGAGQEGSLRALYAGGLEVIEVRPDLAGIPRVLVARAILR
jgi:release factor glutamine methyltransferase